MPIGYGASGAGHRAKVFAIDESTIPAFEIQALVGDFSQFLVRRKIYGRKAVMTVPTPASSIPELDGLDPNVDPGILTTGAVALGLLRDVRSSIELGANTAERRMAQMCQAFFLGKIQRVTQAMLTLVRHGQGEEAQSLLREQYEFIVSLLYYQKHPREATLFVAVHPLVQLDMAEAYVKASINDDERKERENIVDALRPEVQKAIAAFPDVDRPCPGMPKCKRVRTIHRHPWSPIAPKEMLSDLLVDWLRAAYARIGHVVTRARLFEDRDLIAHRFHLVRAHFLSQQKHGLSFALHGSLEMNDLEIAPIRTQDPDPNALVHFILGGLEAVYCDTVRDQGLTGFDDRIFDIKTRLQCDRTRLKITDPAPSITALRDVASP